LEYRKEVDGLRAIAVIPVILYHAGVRGFSGGYVGVDVFFVISGYLITSIILKDLKDEKFSLVNFYERRARRILPALFATLLVTAIVAWFMFLPDEMKILGQGILASAAFSANIFLYAKGDDYFGMQSDENPILHIWSLSVEEQFYFIFPLLMLLVWRFAGKRLNTWLLVISIASLGFSEWLVGHDRSAAFYMLPARAWELLLGALLATRLVNAKNPEAGRMAEVLGLTGLALILGSVVIFDESTPFPGFAALMPVIGTGLVIYYSTQKTWVGKALSLKALIGIGLISYSLYLWHQPVFAFYRSFFRSDLKPVELLVLIVGIFVLSVFTWKYVEGPFRNRELVGRRTIFAVSGAGILLFVAFGIGAHKTSGYPSRDPLFARLVSNVGFSLACNGNTEINGECADSDRPQIAVFGNSFAMHLVDGIRANYPQAGVVQLTQDSCPPHMLDDRERLGKSTCAVFVSNAFNTIRNSDSIKTVIISSPFGDMLKTVNIDAFENTIRKLQSLGKRVLIIGPTPSTGEDFGKCFVRNRFESAFSVCDFSEREISKGQFTILNNLKDISKRNSVEFVDLFDRICKRGNCSVMKDEVLIYRDWGHLSIEGSKEIFKGLKAEGLLSLP